MNFFYRPEQVNNMRRVSPAKALSNSHPIYVDGYFSLGLTVFHDAAIPPDDFVANCNIPFEDLVNRDKEAADFWVNPLTDLNAPFMLLM